MYFIDKLTSSEKFLNEFHLVDGIYRNQAIYSNSQEQTGDTFSYKWKRRDSYESPSMKKNAQKWLLEKYFDGNPASVERCIRGGDILDAGCGAGFSALLLFGQMLNAAHYLGVDISSSVDVAKARFAEEGVQGEFLQTSLDDLPFDKPMFDVIFSEGVLHHTDSTEKSFRYLVRFLKPHGRIMFYVYRKKSDIREFTDDYIRDKLKGMSNEEAWESLLPLSKFGKALGELKGTIKIPETIALLGIPAGEMEIQSFFYYHVCKAFYKENLSLDEMNHINFDWFRPVNCHRHTEEELREWCESEHLVIERMNVELSGITTIARKDA